MKDRIDDLTKIMGDVLTHLNKTSVNGYEWTDYGRNNLKREIDENLDKSMIRLEGAIDECDARAHKIEEKLKKDLSLTTKERESYEKELKEIPKLRQQLEKEILKTNIEASVGKKKLDLKSGRDAMNQITGSRYSGIRQDGQNVTKFGRGLGRIFGENSVLGKAGKGISKFGVVLKRFAGPLSFISQALDVAGAAFNHMAKEIELDTKEIQANNAARKERLALGTRLAQAEFGMESSIVKASQSRDIELATEANNILATNEATAHEIARQSIFDVKGGAFAAANAAISQASQMQRYNINERYSGDILNLTKALEASRFSKEHTKVDADSLVTETRLATERRKIDAERKYLRLDAVGNTLNTVTGGVAGMVGSGFYGGVKNLDFAKMNQDIVKQMFGAEFAKQWTDASQDLIFQAKETNTELSKNAISFQQKIENTSVDAAEKMHQAALKMTQTVFDSFQKAETGAYKLGRELGFSGDQLAKYAQGLSYTQVIVSKWGKTLEDMQKMQSAYQQTTGRNRDFSDADFDKSFAMGMLVGDDTVAQLNAGMEIFNKSIADSNEKFYEMYKQTTKMGLSGVKYTKDLAKNLRLAEKYNFKNGVQGLMDMSKWAQNVRFNTESLDGMLEKVQTGGLEGIIKQSAELQVLGGNFAMGSDPLAMAYEAHMNPAAYAKRMNRMLAGQGMFDSKTGEVSFGIASQIMMRQYAQSTGQNYQDVLNQSRQAVRMEKVGAAINPREAFTDEQKALITNKAEYVNGQWQIKVGKDNKGKDIIKNVGQVSQADVEAMTPIYDNKPMEENISRMRSSAEEMLGLQYENNSLLQNLNWDALTESAKTMLNNVSEDFSRMLSRYSEDVEKYMGTVVDSQKTYLNQFETSMTDPNSVWNTVGQQIQTLIGTPATSLSTLAVKLDDFINNINNAHVDTKEPSEYIAPSASYVYSGSSLNASVASAPRRALSANGNNGLNAWANSMNDGIIAQNGTITKIDSKDQILAAKDGGPISELLNTVKPLSKSGEVVTVLPSSQQVLGGSSYSQISGNIQPQRHNVHTSNISSNRNVIYENILPSDVKPLSKSGEVVTVLPSSQQVLGGSSYSQISGNIQPQRHNVHTSNISSNRNVIYENILPSDVKPLSKSGEVVTVLPNSSQVIVQDNASSSTTTEHNTNNSSSKLEIPPIQLVISGNIQVGANTLDLSQQINNDPMFARTLTQMIMTELAKKQNGGKTSGTLA